MRDLTDEELALAPEWADSYFTNLNGYLIYFDTKSGDAQIFGSDHIIRELPSEHYSFKKCRPLKPFDITQHEWSYFINVEARHDQSKIELESYWCQFDRDDAIAIAKHFNLKAEDLA